MRKLFLLLLIIINLKADRYALTPQVTNIFYDLPTLETDRLVLRKVQPEDLQDLYEIYSDLQVVEYVACELDLSIEDTQKWLEWRLNNAKEGRPVPWALMLKSTKEMIGLCGLCSLNAKDAKGELMILIKRAHWNHGYAQEALKEILNYVFMHMGLNFLEALIHPDNLGSITLHEKLGFTCRGMVPECKYYRGAYSDRLIFTLLKHDFTAAQ